MAQLFPILFAHVFSSRPDFNTDASTSCRSSTAAAASMRMLMCMSVSHFVLSCHCLQMRVMRQNIHVSLIVTPAADDVVDAGVVCKKKEEGERGKSEAGGRDGANARF